MAKKIHFFLFLLLVFSLALPNFLGVLALGHALQPSDLIFLFCLAAYCVTLLIKRTTPRLRWLVVPFGVYFAAMGISAAFSSDPQTSLVKLLGVGYLIALAVLSAEVVEDSQALRIVLRVWIAGAAAASVIALISALTFYIDRDSFILGYTLSHYGTLPEWNYPRVRSTFSNANLFCHYIGLSLMIAISATAAGWIGRRTGIAAVILMGLAALLTLSPAVGGVILGAGILLATKGTGFKRIAARKAAAALGILGGALFFLMVLFRPPAEGVLELAPSARVLAWRGAFETFLEHPITGKGLGTGAASVSYGPQILTDAHNLFLNLGAEAGLLGLAAALFLGVWIVRKGTADMGNSSRSAVICGLAAAFFVGFFYQGLTGSYEDSRHLWVLAGLVVSACGKGEEDAGGPKE